MSKVMIFNPATLDQREVTENDAERAVNEFGWVRVGGANELLAIYHPSQNKHVTILSQDFPQWEAKGYFAEPTVVYHPEQGEKIVSSDTAAKMLASGEGWVDSPGKFSKASTEEIVDRAAKAIKSAK